jgi:hypothetical protein
MSRNRSDWNYSLDSNQVIEHSLHSYGEHFGDFFTSQEMIFCISSVGFRRVQNSILVTQLRHDHQTMFLSVYNLIPGAPKVYISLAQVSIMRTFRRGLNYFQYCPLRCPPVHVIRYLFRVAVSLAHNSEAELPALE